MGIGDVFARAWDLWRRDVGWLVLAGLVVGLILAVILGVALVVFLAIFAAAGVSIGADIAADTTSSLTGLGVGLLATALLVYMVVLFLVQVLSMTFYGGMFEMVIGAYRERRGVRFGDLFGGFRRFGAYALYALVLFGVSLGASVLNVIPFFGWIAGTALTVWIAVIWLYVLPLIADQGLGFGDAARRSNEMVKGAGWWWTFGMVFLLGLAVLAAAVVIVLVAAGVYRADEAAGIAIGVLLFLAAAVLFPPYAICYLSVLYIGAGGDLAPVRAAGRTGIPPAPPAPPAAGVPAGPAPPPPSHAGAAAWRAAADPLAAADATAVTQVTPEPPPEPPQPPAPPEPPDPGPPGS